MRYLLDTNICIYLARRQPVAVTTRFEQLRPGDVGMSVVSFMELTYGALKSQRAEANMARLERLRILIPVEPLDAQAARHYGRLRCELEKKGLPIGGYDLLIAAHALSLGLTLVTNNVREFSRVQGLKIENWVE